MTGPGDIVGRLTRYIHTVVGTGREERWGQVWREVGTGIERRRDRYG